MVTDEAVRRVVVTADDVIQDGVVLHIGTDEAIRSIMARYYPDVPFDLEIDDDRAMWDAGPIQHGTDFRVD